ncbi:MFS transporter [Phenylobacterium sp. LjRoot225]|uniref:MFS transporter n=1 Tax=Phenylobacterium sp. LjRoot225 TaxID=3342285 RepID=UPI003ECD74AD
MVFAMTTDSVGAIIPQIIEAYHLGMAEAGLFHYATMSGIALSAAGLGFLADRLGRKGAIVLGLAIFSAATLLFPATRSFPLLLVLLFVSGLSIGVFKTGALALIGDISSSTRAHTSMMNLVEGFFAMGAIVGPAVIAALLAAGASWTWLYLIAGAICAILVVLALLVRYPTPRRSGPPADLRRVLALARNPYALVFGTGVMLYVGVETAIYVWMPTLLAGYRGGVGPIAAFALPIFFVLRAAGRFLAFWMLGRARWTAVLAFCSLAILVCFATALMIGPTGAAILLPASGLFMSVIYPTLNSKAISCFPKSEHGSAAGLMLFMTCVSAVVSPLVIGLASDAFGDPKAGFVLATGLAALLFFGLAWNLVRDPSSRLLQARDAADYQQPAELRN